MAKRFCSRMGSLYEWIVWIATTLIGLGVGIAAINKVLTVPIVPSAIMVLAGWIVVITTLWASIWKLIDLVR